MPHVPVMEDLLGWTTIAIVLGIPIVFIAVAASTRHRQRSRDPRATSSGGLLGFDELFHPTAHDARLQWEAEQELPAPAPSPDRGPGVIEERRRIVIEIAAASVEHAAARGPDSDFRNSAGSGVSTSG
ncbi:hypothetical protein GCM10009775_35190 [Microbacterium aoyamense]|uniref:Uncharacterized protein n=1 Tax=Microbacterium aoyamense TaxID=344166 RepID=A0ABP5BCB2_9MICO|nr:hypothetical protein [Microbacterium aoyamense]